MEDVHRAGGVMGILGELGRRRADSIELSQTVHSVTMGDASRTEWDMRLTADQGFGC